MSTKGDLFDRLMGMYGQWRMKQIARSYCLAERGERKHRLRTIMALCVELERIRQVDIFSTGLAETLIEEIIEGDWRQAALTAEMFTFAEEGEETRLRYAPLWDGFVVMARTACAEAQRGTDGVRGRN